MSDQAGAEGAEAAAATVEVAAAEAANGDGEKDVAAVDAAAEEPEPSQLILQHRTHPQTRNQILPPTVRKLRKLFRPPAIPQSTLESRVSKGFEGSEYE